MSSVNASTVGSKPFRPSAVMLLRIMKVLVENNFIGRTELALQAKVQYTRLTAHLNWMKQRNIVETMVIDDVVDYALTEKGKDFANLLFAIFELEYLDEEYD